MIPSRLALVLLPLLALLGLPIFRQVEVCCGHDQPGSSAPRVAVMHWAGACPCDSHPATDAATDAVATDAAATGRAAGVACDCSDAPLITHSQVALVVDQPILLPPIAPTRHALDLAFASQPRPSAKAPRQARPPPVRCAALTHLAYVRLLI